MPILSTSLLASLLALHGADTAPPADATAAGPSVRIYRCVGSNGQIALQDAPCQQGSQQVLDMRWPKDPPPAPALVPAPPAATAPPSAPPPRVVVVNSRPLYECTTPEGERYTADDGEGNPRWVPGPLVPVIIGHGLPRPPMHRPPLHRPPGTGGGHHPPPPGRPHGGHATALVPAGGQWVRDSCQQLTRQEACTVLSGQRWELISRYNSALSSERSELVREQRRVEQRMEQQPCGN